MNTTQLIEQKIKDGKCKYGVCQLHDSKEIDLLYRVGAVYACWTCVERLDKVLGEK